MGAQASAPVRPKAFGSAKVPNAITKLTLDVNVAHANRIPATQIGMIGSLVCPNLRFRSDRAASARYRMSP